MQNSIIKSKFIGSLIGSALGDCIGELAFRYQNREELIREITNRDIIRYTDDTAMAIGLAESIIENNGRIIANKLGIKFHENFNKEPYRGYGMGPPKIFHTVERTKKKYVEVAKKMFKGEGSYGNGAAMRVTPLGIFFYDSKDLYSIVRESAIVTHAHPYGIEGAALLAKLNSVLISKDPLTYSIYDNRETILNILLNFAETVEYRKKLSDIRKLLDSNSRIELGENELGSNVLAITSVSFSIFAFLKNPNSFETSLLDAILISRDRDTVGAMLGGLLGSYLGIEKIPNDWYLKLENGNYIKDLGQKLFQLKFI
jgi:poly(ADP-ribose) glycohydrolase ARH3